MKTYRRLRKSTIVRGVLLAALLGAAIVGGRAEADIEGIQFDAASTATTGTTAKTGLTFSHTVSSAEANRYLLVTIAMGGGGSVSTVSYAGTSLTVISEKSTVDAECTSMSFGLANPATGTNNIVILRPTAKNMVAGGISFLNINQGTPGAAVADGTSSTATVDVSTSYAGTYVADVACTCIDIGCVGGGATGLAVGSGQTSRWGDSATGSGFDVRGGSSNEVGTATTTMSWGLDDGNHQWASVALSFAKTTATAGVRFAGFDAARDGSGVHIGWRTGLEIDNLGFVLHREIDGHRTRITRGVVPGSALTVGSGVSMLAGRAYGFTDRPPVGGQNLRYWLEEIDLGGARTMHGPIVPSRSVLTAAMPDLLGPGVSRVKAGAPRGLWTEETRRIAADFPAAMQIRRHQAALTSYAKRLKIVVKDEGWYSLTMANLMTAGLDPAVDASRLRLTREGKEIGLQVNDGGDGRLDSADRVEFFATGVDSPWTDEAVYWLDAETVGAGRRVNRRTSGIASGVEGASFPSVAEVKERDIYFGALLNGEKENFFGPMIRTAVVQVPVRIVGLDAGVPASLEVALQGVSEGHHQVETKLSDTALGVGFMGRDAGIMASPIDPRALVEGDNLVLIRALGGDQDMSVLDRIRISYGRRYLAVDGTLRFTAGGGKEVELAGFPGGDVRAFDITAPDAVDEILTEAEVKGGARFIKLVPPGEGTRTFLAITDDRIRSPVAVRGDDPSSWAAASSAADLVIISHRDFKDQLGPLRALRESEGLTVALADVEDIYDEFSHGIKSPYAIRAFIENARAKWSKKPRYVLLVGDASFDAKNYLGKGSFDFVPSKYLDQRLLETSSDDWFVTVEGESYPDIAIGRLPVRTAEEAAAVVAKIVAFKQGQGRARDFLLVADQDNRVGFETTANQLGESQAGRLQVAKLYRAVTGEETRPKLLEALSAGPLVAGFVGHGSEDLWGGGNPVLTSSDASKLTNDGRPSLYLPMTCLTNYFQNALHIGLGKALLLAPNGGALAVWGSSALMEPSGQTLLNRALLDEVFQGSHTLGDAILAAKVKHRDPALTRSFILLGDPSTRLFPADVVLPGGENGTTAPPDVEGPGSSPTQATADGAVGTGCSCRLGVGRGPGGLTGAPLALLMLITGISFRRWRRRRP